jgi:tetratricopeptide (TPR) repeat protein
MAHFHLDEYDQAIEAWEAGFRIRPVPEFLYNIAQAHRLAKRPDKALKFYGKFLQVAPNAPNRAEVERHMTALERQVRENNNAATTPSTTHEPTPPTTQPETTAPTPPATPPPSATPEPAATQLVATPPPKKPLYKKGWFWGVIGGTVAAAVIVGVTVGILVGRRDQAAVLNPVRF